METTTLKNKFNKLVKWGFICGFIASLVTLVISFFASDYLNYGWINFLFKTRQQAYQSINNKPSKNIKIVLFDNESNQRLNLSWPYDRKEVAKAINYLTLAGSKAVIFDIIFSEEKPQFPGSDEKLIEAVKNGPHVILGSSFITTNTPNKQEQALVKQFALDVTFKSNRTTKKDFFFAEELQFYDTPFPALLKVAADIGFFNIPESEDVKRQASFLLCTKENCYSSLPLTGFLSLIGSKQIEIAANHYLKVKNITIPLRKNSLYYVNWYGSSTDTEHPEYIYDSQSAWALIKSYDNIMAYATKYNMTPQEVFNAWYYDTDPRVSDMAITDPDKFKNKIIFMGVSSFSAEDYIHTPFGTMPGVYMHAFILDNIINQNFIKIPPIWINVLILFVLCILTSLTVFFASAKDNVVYLNMPVVYIIFFAMLCIDLFGHFNILLNWSMPTMGIILALISAYLGYFLVEGKDKKRVKEAMTNYLSPQILKVVMDNPEQLKASASKRKKLTILFSDIRGFTTFSESNPPELVVRMLNEYHSEMTNIIFKYNGTLDKFIGDAVMAFWNAPVDVEDHTMMALKTAMEMMTKLKELNSIWEKVYKHTVNIGIGINTEEVVVGNIGSEKFMDYTVIGDGVNLAARLEGLNKQYNTNIIISEYTYRLVQDRVQVKFLDSVKVKGKTTETKIYELISINDSEYNHTEEIFDDEF
jgi:class 3 adenylate cyclase/CHASE2 domain-containing sensor protein